MGDLLIQDKHALTSITSLDNAISIGGDLKIIYNGFLTNLTGLDNFTSIEGGISILNNNALTSLTGLGNVASIGGTLSIWGNDALTNLTRLDNVTSIGKSLSISGNDALTSLTGLDNVSSIGGYLNINDNDALTSLTGLGNIDAGSISNLSIIFNISLSSCEVQSICDYLASPNGTIEIHDNGPGCNSQSEVADACGIVGIDPLQVAGCRLWFIQIPPMELSIFNCLSWRRPGSIFKGLH